MIPLAFAAWVQLLSPHFELLTDAGERPGRDAIAGLEMIRHVFSGTGVSPLPVRAFLFRSESDFAHYRSASSTRGFYQSGPDRNYIAVLAGPEMRRVVFHEYVHLVLNHTVGAQAKWMEEGTAEFFSTVELRDGRLVTGLPIASHLRLLASERWLSEREMEQIDEHSPGLYYAQSWARVHMLRNSGKAGLDALPAYLRRPLPVQSIAWSVPDAVGISARPLDDTAAVVAQVELLLQIGNHARAGKLLSGLEQRLPNSAAVQHELALYALARGDKEEALRRFDRAIALGKASADTYFESATLLRDMGGPRDRVRQLLAEAAGRNPQHAEAHFLLGLMAASEGRHDEAIPSLERAVAILPRQPSFRDALLSSRQALARAPAPARRDGMVTPPSWQNPKGDASARGLLEHVECLGESARIRVQAGGKPLYLFIARPGQVLLNDSSSLTASFTCGPQSPPRPVDVEYKSATSEVTALRFPQ